MLLLLLDGVVVLYIAEVVFRLCLSMPEKVKLS